MKKNIYFSSKHIFQLTLLLTITPFIIFLGKNFSQLDLFTSKYFWMIFFYCSSFMLVAIGMYFFFKKGLFVILFFAYLSLIQFYYFNIQQFFRTFKDGSTGYYVLTFIIFLSLILTILSSRIIFRKFILILLLLNLAISSANLIPILGKSFIAIFKSDTVFENSSTSTSFTTIKSPNIFYIVPDGLASPKILKEYANIDFDVSIKNFENKGFVVPKHSYSSYNSTYLSLATLFRMDYPVTEKSLIYKNSYNFYPTIRDKKPEIVMYLKKHNYKFVIIPPSWGGCPTDKFYTCLKPFRNSFFSNFFQDYAIYTMIKYSFFKKFLDHFNLFLDGDMDDSGKTALDQMKKNEGLWSDNGIFTMIHMFMPHDPYREKDCTVTDRYPLPSKEGYKSSVYCAFNRIHELSDFIIKKYPNASIVVQSDHGVYVNDVPEERKFKNISDSLIDYRLAAYTAVRGCKSNEAAKLNQANIVEYIVDCLLNRPQSKKFENKSFFGFNGDSIEYGKVYRVYKK